MKRRSTTTAACSFFLFGSCVINCLVAGDEKTAKAPANHAIVGDTINGWYFVPQEMKKEYDDVLARLEALQSDVDAGKVNASTARRTLDELREKLKRLRAAIDSARILVPGAEIHEQTETIEFDLGPEKRLAISANEVHVMGWERPNVRIEVKKVVLSNDGRKVDDQLSAIKTVHTHGRAEFAGQTDAEWEASEAEFNSKQGANFTAEQREQRRKFVDSIRQSYAMYRDLLNKEINQVSIDGLDYESNKSITLNVKSESGDGRMSSVRQRYATLVAYVPRCTSVTIRGAERGLQVKDLAADLVLVPHGSTDSDASGQFAVTGLTGNLRCYDFPLHTIQNVKGNIDVRMTTEEGLVGAGTLHSAGMRTMTSGRPFAVQVHDVTGDVNLTYGRVHLDLKNLGGRIDVVNRFGETMLVSGSLASKPHRIYSHSGAIDVTLSELVWKTVPILAVTNHGTARTNVGREGFEDFHLEGEDKADGWRCTFQGFRTVEKDEDRFVVFSLFDRFNAIATGAERTPGLDLFSRHGRISLLRE